MAYRIDRLANGLHISQDGCQFNAFSADGKYWKVYKQNRVFYETSGNADRILSELKQLNRK